MVISLVICVLYILLEGSTITYAILTLGLGITLGGPYSVLHSKEILDLFHQDLKQL